MKIRFLFDGNFEIQNRDQHFEAGNVIECDVADAERLITGGCAEAVLDEQPKRKRAKDETTWPVEQ